MSTPRHDDRCTGTLLGTACGDILGAAVEGWPAEAIRAEYGRLADFVETDRGAGCYTDDTQMTLALAESLIEEGDIDATQAAAKYAQRFQPWRGYGTAAQAVMQALRRGVDPHETGRMQFPGGSFGNGGAMRIAPIGLAFRHADNSAMYQAVQAALLCTHVHPEAVDGAFVQAKAVALAAASGTEDFDLAALPGRLASTTTPGTMRDHLERLGELLAQGNAEQEVVARLGNGVRTREAVAAALWCFVRFGRDPEECIVRAVALGGDTDTIGALTGALAGALHGAAWIPSRWLERMENGPFGRDAIASLGRRLAALDLR